MKYTFGADPEIFVTMQTIDGNTLIPAYMVLPDYKKGVCFNVHSGGVHPDNVTLEINPNPAESFERVAMNARDCLDHFSETLHAFVRDIKDKSSFKYNYLPTWDISKMTIGKDNPRLFEFGCDPDYNAYTEEQNDAALLPENLRVAGGHIMISAPDERLYDPEIAFLAVQWMDILVFPHTVDLRMSASKENKRREFYGKAGSFRPKKFDNGNFGIEYRVPSNAWMTFANKRDTFDKLTFIEQGMVQSVELALMFERPRLERDKVIDAVHNVSRESVNYLLSGAV